MKALIIEDEKPAARRLTKLLLEVDPTIDIVATLESVEATVQWLSNNTHPQIMLMDIQLADGSSFDIFKKIDISCPVIFITAYDEYAIDAFKAVSYTHLTLPTNREV